jgi:hypothetical protein
VRIAVTGATGRIGRMVVDLLAAHGEREAATVLRRGAPECTSSALAVVEPGLNLCRCGRMLLLQHMMHRVFISYAQAQQLQAEKVCELLEERKIRCWIATRDIAAGTDWVDRIPQAVEQAELVIVLLSPEALSSDWVDRELNWAIARNRPLLPVLLGDTAPSERVEFLLGTIQSSTLPEQPQEGDLLRLVAHVDGLLEGDRAREFVSEAQPAEAPPPEDPFAYKVTEARPAYFVLLVDHSASMNRYVAGRSVQARQAVAEVVNDLLFELLRTTLRAEGYRNYFDISVLGYGVGDGGEVVSELPGGQDRIGIAELDHTWIDTTLIERIQTLSNGSERTVTLERPVWIRSVPNKGRTVTAEAFRKATSLVDSWIADHQDSFPPVVLNISDGGWTGEDPMKVVRALQERTTSRGSTLVFNCQFGSGQSDDGDQLIFPSEVPDGFHRRTRELFMLSSVLPESMRNEARQRGIEVDDEARGLFYNAPVSSLVDFLQVGTTTTVM